MQRNNVPEMFGIDFNRGGQEREVANTIKARYDAGVSNFKQDRTAVCIPVLTPDRIEKRQNGRRFKEDGEESFTLTGQDRHGVGIGVPIKEATKKGYAVVHEGDSINLSMPDSKTRRGRIGGGDGADAGHKLQSGSPSSEGEYP